MLEVGRRRKIYKKWTSNGGDNWGWCWKKWQEHSFVGDNAREDIAKNCLLDLMNQNQFKNETARKMYKRCTILLQNSYNIKYAVLLLQVKKYRPLGGVSQGCLRKWKSRYFDALALCRIYAQVQKKDYLNFLSQTKTKKSIFLTHNHFLCISRPIKRHGTFERVRADLFKYELLLSVRLFFDFYGPLKNITWKLSSV